ncbi:MAG: glutathione S-transferase family protein [Alcanivorax sp.]|uniref:glutathione S-transferase family protein n=1 Tax=Alcanivorax sp. TaxID=1872427 RepID=UPI003DA7767C
MTATESHPIRLYQFPLSGHSHRVLLFLSLLDVPHETVYVDLPGNAHKSADFLAMNPFGQVPVINDNDTILADANAILVYLASRYDNGRWLPEEPVAAAHIQRWLSVAAGPLYLGPCCARLATLFGADIDTDRAIRQSHDLLTIMDAELTKSDFLTGNTPTLADIAMYSYTAHAPEGNISLAPYPRARQWLSRIEALPGFIAMDASPVGLNTQEKQA